MVEIDVLTPRPWTRLSLLGLTTMSTVLLGSGFSLSV